MARGRPRLLSTVPVLFITLLLAAGCRARDPAPALPGGLGQPAVSVLYAGSLVNLMETDLGPAFTRESGYPFRGEGKGSVALAHQIRDRLRTPDVFISADPAVNALLMGPENGHQVRWYAVAFQNELVVAYNPRSLFAAEYERARTGEISFLQALDHEGIRLGRTDPKLDPKGYRTLFLFQLAAAHYGQPDLAKRVLGDAENPAQILPEEQLAARLEAGQLDAGIFYRNEALAHRLPHLTLPREVNLSDPALDGHYAGATYTSPAGQTYRGGAIRYTVTIPMTAPRPAGAAAFVRFLLSPAGRRILEQHGLHSASPEVAGDRAAIPAELQTLLEGKRTS